MPLPLPNLDDRTYADLLEEARSLIPGLYPRWTNHNPSDPGITLIELFAWLTEMLIYRTNRVPDDHLLVFLKLLNGPDWLPGPDLDADIRKSVVALRERFRAVTADDYEALALEAAPAVARARCVPRRSLESHAEAERARDRPSHVSVIIVPEVFCVTARALDRLRQAGVPATLRSQLAAIQDQPFVGSQAFTEALQSITRDEPTIRLIRQHTLVADPQPAQALADLNKAVWEYLEPRRLLTTRQHVVSPVYVPVSADILLARRADMPAADLRATVTEALADFLHALIGGVDGRGWPFGRDVYVSELYQLLENIPGVDYVPDIRLSSQCPADAQRCVAATELWHVTGDQIGLGLAAHHLPWAQINPDRIVIAATFVPVQVRVQMTPQPSADMALVWRTVKTAIKQFFSPLAGGNAANWQTQAWTVTRGQLVSLVESLPIITSVQALELQGDTSVTSVRFEARTLADVQVFVEHI